MILNRGVWRDFKNLWPVEYSQKYLTKCEDEPEITSGYTKLYLEIRGNCLFGYNVDGYSADRDCEPIVVWVLEHAHIYVRTDTFVSAYNENYFATVELLKNSDSQRPFLRIFTKSKDAAIDLYDELNKCSLTSLKHLVNKDMNVSTHLALNRLESLKYEHAFIKRQHETLKLDNTLLLTQSSVNKQVFSEYGELYALENAQVKEELERILEVLKSKESTIEVLKNELKAYRSKISDNQAMNNELRETLSSTSAAIDDVNSIPEKRLRVMYTKRTRQANLLSLRLLGAKHENATILSKYHSLKQEMSDELNRIHEILRFDDMYDMLKLWVVCNELKVDYYEKMMDMTPEEQNKSLKHIEMVQEDLKVATVIARASYITYRTYIFNQILKSCNIGVSPTFNKSQVMINEFFERLSWIFHPETCKIDDHKAEPLWINPIKVTQMVEKKLYKNDVPWYNRLSFASALKPVLNYDACNKNELELKKQLYYCVNQNLQLGQKIRSLNRQIGSDAHWKSIWKRANKVPAK